MTAPKQKRADLIRADLISRLAEFGVTVSPSTNTKYLLAMLNKAELDRAHADAIATDERMTAAVAEVAAKVRAQVDREHAEALLDNQAYDVGQWAKQAQIRQHANDAFDRVRRERAARLSAGAKKAWETRRRKAAQVQGPGVGATPTPKSHRDLYPEQYSHELCGKEVDVMDKGQIVVTGVVTRVVSTRFGLLAILDGNSEQAWSAADCRVVVQDSPETLARVRSAEVAS